jgi:hypothetical protein
MAVDFSGIENAIENKLKYIMAISEYYAKECEKEAKGSVPWTDRTYSARDKLLGVAFRDETIDVVVFENQESSGKKGKGKTAASGGYTINGEGTIGFALCHRMEYGKYLERDGDGQYAILKPTVEKYRGEWERKVRDIIES